MTRLFENQRFVDITDRESAATFSDMEFQRCHFEACDVSITFDPTKRSTFRNIKFTQCFQTKCTIWPAIIESVTLEGLDTGRILIANACVFKHVVLRGKVGNIKICRSIPWVSDPANLMARRQEAMDQANLQYYSCVDWALDISKAEFLSGEVEGIPPELIRRDPETQFVLTAHAIAEAHWRQLDLSGTYWGPLLEAYNQERMTDVILIAPKAAPDFSSMLKGLRMLREAGIVE